MTAGSCEGAGTRRTHRPHENGIGEVVVDVAVKLHRELGPGLLESVYETILSAKLRSLGYEVQRQVAIPLKYEGIEFEEVFRADVIINDLVLLELKAVEKITYSHRKQLQTYLTLSGMKLGYLLNFNEGLMRDGIHRIVNGLDE